MKTININTSWFRTLFPKGISYPSSTLISGKGGSGKPLVELAFVAEWLRSGRPVIGMPLQYSSPEFAHAALKDLFNLDVSSYKALMSYIHFNPGVSKVSLQQNNIIEANLLDSQQWGEALKISFDKFNTDTHQVLFFGAAFNLLLFSPKYMNSAFNRVKQLLSERSPEFTTLISVSTSAMHEKITHWENAADNLLFTELDKDKKLWLFAERMRHDTFSTEKVHLPISKNELAKMREIAGKSRDNLIPRLKQIK